MERPEVLVGGLGYRNLSDHSLGVSVSDRLAERAWPEGVVVEDVSYNPIALSQRLQDAPPARAIIVAAVPREGREPGAIEAYSWDNALPGPEAIQQAVSEAVTGVISLDNTLIVTRHFGGLPREVVVVEVEPQREEFGDTMSPVVAAAYDEVCDLVSRLAIDAGAARRIAEAPIGRGRKARESAG